MFENDVILQQPADLLQLTEKYVNAASHFIETNASKSIVYVCWLSIYSVCLSVCFKIVPKS